MDRPAVKIETDVQAAPASLEDRRWANVWAWFQYLDHQLNSISGKVTQMAVDISKLQSDVSLLPALATALNAGFAALKQQIVDLQAQIAAGGVAQADIDALDKAVMDFEASVNQPSS